MFSEKSLWSSVSAGLSVTCTSAPSLAVCTYKMAGGRYTQLALKKKPRTRKTNITSRVRIALFSDRRDHRPHEHQGAEREAFLCNSADVVSCDSTLLRPATLQNKEGLVLSHGQQLAVWGKKRPCHQTRPAIQTAVNLQKSVDGRRTTRNTPTEGNSTLPGVRQAVVAMIQTLYRKPTRSACMYVSHQCKTRTHT